MTARRRRAPAELVVDDARRARLIELGRSQCTEAEAASALGFGVEALTGNAKAVEALNQGRAEGLEALRRAQLKLAETSAPLAMFLGRNYLDQSDRRETEPSGAKEVPDAVQRLVAKLSGSARTGPARDRAEGD